MAQEVSMSGLMSRVGDETGVSEWFVIDQERIDAFASATLDHQSIHVDPVAAVETTWGTTIAHGYLTLSLVPFLIADIRLVPEGTRTTVNYGSDKARFLQPVKVGSAVRARVRLADVSDKGGGRYLVRNDVTVEIDGEDRPALIAELLTLFIVG